MAAGVFLHFLHSGLPPTSVTATTVGKMNKQIKAKALTNRAISQTKPWSDLRNTKMTVKLKIFSTLEEI